MLRRTLAPLAAALLIAAPFPPPAAAAGDRQAPDPGPRDERAVPASLHVTAAAPAPQAPDPGRPGYYRFPAIHGETVVFTAEGDLWTVSAAGGTARRLTTHPAEEANAAISPDGRTIAFTASYEGPAEVYTMPIEGGPPARRSWDGGGATVVGWTPDGDLLYATRRYSTLPDTRLIRVDLASGTRQPIPLAQAAEASLDPAGRTLFFTRLPFQGSHAKRYRGGTAQSIWRFALPADADAVAARPADEPAAKAAAEAVPLTRDWPGTSKNPIWWQGRIYHLSDRDGTVNLWSMDEAGGDLRQHTRHQGLDVRSADLHDGRIVYRLGADLRILDLRSGEDRPIPIRLASDFDHFREKWVHEPMDWVTSAHLSPSGDRVVLTARGQVFVAPARQGRLVEATREAGARYRNARFLPDGRSLLALSDRSGEVELWRLPANGVGRAEQLTADGTILRWDALPSPDGRRIAHTDKNQRLWIHDVERGTNRLVAESPRDDLRDLAWSPDSRRLAFVETAASSFRQIMVHDAETGRTVAATGDRYDSYSPAWSPDGSWLFFLSDRDFQSLVRSPWGPRQPEPFFDRQTRIYLLALHDGLRSPFQPDDELAPAERAMDGEDASRGAAGAPGRGADARRGNDAARAGPAAAFRLDPADLHVAPVPPGNYSELATDGERLYWLDRETSLEGKRSLRALEIGNDDPKPVTLVEDVRGYELSADRKKILIRKGNALHVIDAGSRPPGDLAESRVDLSGWRFSLDPREEWLQMFTEAWRLHRDYFYDPGMHGVDWPAMREKYRPLAERVTDRAELSDVIAQMVSELSALHTSVRGGDHRKGPDDVQPASLGAVLARDQAAGGWRVERIYRSEPDLPDDLAPLARPGVDVREGDVVLAVDGEDALSAPDPGALLRGKAGRQVLLRVRPGAGGPDRDVVVTPISMREEADLRYTDWEYSRRLAVDELAGGRVGYVHLRAMGPGDMAQWTRDFYPVFHRDALIVDARHNRGGNIDSWILEKLLRRAWMYWKPRVGEPYWNMQYALRGPIVVLVNEWTASDGEAFAEGFRRLGLGKVIGTRTWGGEIWLTSSNVLVDRGIATAAEFGVYGPEGEWLIEGHGVDPDVVVDNLPHETFLGRDAQLEAAVQHLLSELERNPVPVPPPPPYPDKSGGP